MLRTKERWQSDDCLHDTWNVRTAFMAGLISEPCKVVDFGAGAEHLSEHLPVGSRYVPVDIKKRSPRTVVLDLDAAEASQFPTGRVAFLSGVLEYISDLPGFAAKLAKYPVLIASYTPHYAANHDARTARGWSNSYSIHEFLSIFEKAGFRPLEMREFGNQRVFRFKRRKSQPQTVDE